METPCMAEKGVEWPTPWQPLDRKNVSPSFTAGGARLVTEEIAAKYGYETIPYTYDGQAEWRKSVAEVNQILRDDPSGASRPASSGRLNV